MPACVRRFLEHLASVTSSSFGYIVGNFTRDALANQTTRPVPRASHSQSVNEFAHTRGNNKPFRLCVRRPEEFASSVTCKLDSTCSHMYKSADVNYVLVVCCHSGRLRLDQPSPRTKVRNSIAQSTHVTSPRSQKKKNKHEVAGSRPIRQMTGSCCRLNNNAVTAVLTHGNMSSWGAVVAKRLACSPPTKANLVQSPAGSPRIFTCGNRVGRCRWSAGILEDLSFHPPLHTCAAPYSLQSPSSALKTSLLRTAQISSLTPSSANATTHKLTLNCSVHVCTHLGNLENREKSGRDSDFESVQLPVNSLYLTRRDERNRLHGSCTRLQMTCETAAYTAASHTHASKMASPADKMLKRQSAARRLANSKHSAACTSQSNTRLVPIASRCLSDNGHTHIKVTAAPFCPCVLIYKSSCFPAKRFEDKLCSKTLKFRTTLDKIDYKRGYAEVTFAIGSEFIRNTLDDSAPIADFQGNKKRIPYLAGTGESHGTIPEIENPPTPPAPGGWLGSHFAADQARGRGVGGHPQYQAVPRTRCRNQCAAARDDVIQDGSSPTPNPHNLPRPTLTGGHAQTSGTKETTGEVGGGRLADDVIAIRGEVNTTIETGVRGGRRLQCKQGWKNFANSFRKKIDVKDISRAVIFAVGTLFIAHSMLPGVCGNTVAAANEQTSEALVYALLCSLADRSLNSRNFPIPAYSYSVSRQMEVIEMSMEQRRNERAGEREIPEKTRQALSGTIPTCENPGVTQPVIEPGVDKNLGTRHGEKISMAVADRALGLTLINCELVIVNSGSIVLSPQAAAAVTWGRAVKTSDRWCLQNDSCSSITVLNSLASIAMETRAGEATILLRHPTANLDVIDLSLPTRVTSELHLDLDPEDIWSQKY
ncbi:hypothetical protein PR048_014289 [Dryococelus australis]|uniref:Uncharacterized protein n=1 Tax=Dryococelus australis TaxID=614101 RepID=A0ABQ9HDT9_9NEOP|nr:hypothetical protein PR048_014289 [Dryococelus australis]